jgi:hypothetical protein
MKLAKCLKRSKGKILKFGEEARTLISQSVELSNKLAKISLGPGVS